jgi:uncharacterized protein
MRKTIFQASLIGICLLLIVTIFGIGALHLTSASAKAAPKAPAMLKLTSYDIGSYTFIQAGYAAEAITEKFGTRIRLIPFGNDVSRMVPCRAGDTLGTVTGASFYYAFDGIDIFSTLDWGPQKIHAVRLTKHPGIGLAVSGDSGIKTPADLRGKKVGFVPGAPGLSMPTECVMAYGGLTWDDVERVTFSAYKSLLDGHRAGQVDAFVCAVTTPYTLELASSRSGIKFLEVPPDDKAAWERVQKVTKLYAPTHSDLGSAKDNNVWMMTYACPAIMAYDNVDEDKIYFLTKAIDETEHLWKKKAEMMRMWSDESNWGLFKQGLVPMHKGAIRYYKEIGQWTAEYEAINQSLLSRQDKLQEAWDGAVEKALEKKIKSKDFPEFWLKYREDQGL